MKKRTRRILLILFFLSGFAALLYQVVWQRMLVFYTGSDTVSISLIVTAFMSGLGLGYLAGGKLADSGSHSRNLLHFVLAELGILLFAVFSKNILYDWLYLSGPSANGNALVLYTMVFAVLLVPTFLMGVSLPLLSRAFRMDGTGEQAGYVSSLYFMNTLGAAFGALVTGVVLVRTMGFDRALWVGVAFNGICAAGALVLSKRAGQESLSTTTAGPGDTPYPASPAPQPLRFTPTLVAWLVQYGLSGFAALSLELIWFRVLETLIKSVSLTFSILLAIYLGSMAIGTALGNKWVRNKPESARERLFLRAQFMLYAYVGLSFLVFLGAIFRVDGLGFLWNYFKSYEPDLSLRILLPTYVIIPLFLMFIPTFLMGLSFAVSQSLIQDKVEEVGRKVGLLQFVNIAGSALGAWAVTWIGFNTLGTATLLKVITCIGLFYLVLLYIRKHQRPLVSVGVGAAVLILVIVFPSNADFWRRLNGIQEADRFIYDENESGLSIIKRYDRGSGLVGVVFANGLGQSIMPFHKDPIHTELGLLPVLLHPRPETVAVIGLGSGGTLYGTAARAVTKKLVCFEIMSNQLEVLATYAERASDTTILGLLQDPRLQMIMHDGRYQLTTMPEKYDVIEADALRPNSAFSGNIYSKEYFQLLSGRLKPGGIAVSWCPTPRVLTTIRQAFPYVAHIEGFLVIGSNDPIVVDWDAVLERAADPFTRDHLASAGIDIGTLIAPYKDRFVLLANDPALQGVINTDLFPRDEFVLPYTWAYIRKKLGFSE